MSAIPEEKDPYDSEEYREFVASCAKDCHCPETVCDGVLSGGFCDSFGHDDESGFEDLDDCWPSPDELAEMHAEEAELEQQQEWQGLQLSLVERCKKESNYTDLTRLQRWGYVLKLFICFALKRHWKPCYGNYPDVVMTALIYHRPTYAGWEEEWIEVGHGLWKNWFYQLNRDSEWNM